jgi:hypothetical protein
MSWLSLSPSDPSVAPYIAEIQRLERELGWVNESIDEKLDRLEHVGFGNVELEVFLNDERARTAALGNIRRYCIFYWACEGDSS